MNQHFLITGATGFVGSELLRTIFERFPDAKVTVLVRPSRTHGAAERIKHLQERWRKFGLDPINMPDLIRVVEHDFESQSISRLPSDATVIFHAAASTDFDLPLSIARQKNVRSTLQMLQLGRQSPHLKRFFHFSTAFVVGKNKGLLDEESVPDSFNNTYEQTKWESEQAVRQSGLPFTILRPSIITGSSDNGYILGLKVIYSVVRLWLSGILPRAPVDPNETVDIVPIDFVVNSALALFDAPDAENQVYNATVGGGVLNRRIIEQAMHTFSIPEPAYVPLWVAKFLRRPPGAYLTTHNVREALELMKWHIPYLGLGGKRFSNRKLLLALRQQGVATPDFSEFGPNMFRFCKETSWGRRPWRRLSEEGRGVSA